MFEERGAGADGEDVSPQGMGPGRGAEAGGGSAPVRAILAGLSAALSQGVEQLRGCDPAVLVAELDAVPPGPLGAALLAAIDVASLPDLELIEVIKARGGQIAGQEAGMAEALAAFAEQRLATRTGLGNSPEQVAGFAAAEVGAALGLSRGAARHRLEYARLLLERLPGTLAALRGGRIDAARARVITEETLTLDDARAAQVEARVLVRAPGQTPRGLRDSCRRAVLRADPDAARDRHERAVEDRGVATFPLEDGMAQLIWTDRADRVLGFSVALDALARAASNGNDRDDHGSDHHAGGGAGGDRRSMQQARADVLTDLGARLLSLEGLPTEQGARPQINVTVPLGTLLEVSREPAELVGYGPIPAELARAIAAEGTWRRLLTDPASGALLDLGRDRYRPPAALREFVLARDLYCQGLGCTVPARRCEIDHRVDWAHGGQTRAGDLDSLCAFTHRLKHQGGWSRQRTPDGATVWQTPTGHEYLRYPDWLPGAKPPLPLTPAHQKAIREHAAMLGISLPRDPHSTPDAADAANAGGAANAAHAGGAADAANADAASAGSACDQSQTEHLDIPIGPTVLPPPRGSITNHQGSPADQEHLDDDDPPPF